MKGHTVHCSDWLYVSPVDADLQVASGYRTYDQTVVQDSAETQKNSYLSSESL